MIQLKSAYTDQTSTISKLLKDDWEPFAVIQIKVKEGPKLRMYFRKYDPVVTEQLASEVETQELRISAIDRADILDTATRFTQALNDWSNDFFERLEKSRGGSSIPVKAEQEPDGDWVIKKDEQTVTFGGDNAEPEESNLAEMPDGDGFRVVDEIPNDLTSTNNRTPQQDARIEKLKASEGNVSVLPGGSRGEVRVMAGTIIYTIKPDGNFTTEETGANTSALG